MTNESTNGSGPTNQPSWEDHIFVSTDPTGATGLHQIASFTHVGVLGLGDSTRTAEVVLPIDVSGKQYTFVCTGGPFEFIYTDNNTARSNELNVQFVPPPRGDLQPTDVTGPATAQDGQAVDISWTVRNNGPDPIDGSWVDTLYVAPSGNFSQAIEIGWFRRSQHLDAGKTYTRSEVVRVPAHRQGVFQYFVRTDSDSEFAEANEDQ